MKDEFLKKCEAVFSETKNENAIFNMTIETVNTMLDFINPITEQSVLFIIPALRHIADMFENSFTEEAKKKKQKNLLILYI